MGEFELLRLAIFRRPMMLSAMALLVTAVAACSSTTPVPDNGEGPDTISLGEIQGSGEAQGSDEAQLTDEIVVPEFDTTAFAAINPDTAIRPLNRKLDFQGEFNPYEDARIPRDAINPVYSPIFVSPDEATLNPKELVMGLEINGDARAYPVGMMRIREMVNDEVGGTPVLVTW